jgi:hypothetical protein
VFLNQIVIMTDANVPDTPDDRHDPTDEPVTDEVRADLPDDSFAPLPWDEPGDFREAPIDDDFHVLPDEILVAETAPEWDATDQYKVEPDPAGDEIVAENEKVEDFDEVLEVAAPPARPRRDDRGARLRELNLAIEVYPEAALNYVLRAEFLLEQGEKQLAENDFETALALATEQLESDSWGVINQVVIDRARLGLNDIG